MKEKDNILIRKGKLGDEIGMAQVAKEGFKRKNWLYTGSNASIKKNKTKNLRKTISSKNPDHYVFVAIDKNTGKLVGSVMASFKKSGRIRHRIDLGWGLHPDYQGKGIGTSLLKEILKYAKKKGFKRAEAEMAIENKASWKMALKCGFKIEGKKNKAMITDDKRYIDTYIVGKIL
jgi:RimJ/RimL family protein N-acetyltransferase